ncbi:MAG: hypothetical protein PHO53_03255 [Actinomycetota bacterium]|nr:hypothetical protein [Actinomycetota bacterium]
MADFKNHKFIERVNSLKDTLFGAFGVMVAAVIIAGIINYLFNLVLNRFLPRADFGDLYSMEAIYLIVTMGCASIQTVIAKYVAQFESRGERENTRALARSFARWLPLAGITAILVCSALAFPIAKAMKLHSALYLPILGISIAGSLFLTLPNGLLQGREDFLLLGGAQVSYATLRILFAILLVQLGLGVGGAIGAGAISAFLVGGIVVYHLREIFRGKVEENLDFKPVHALKFLIPVALAQFFVIFLSQIDVILVKGLFSPQAAGTYSYAALAGKAVLFLPDGISLVMFPRVSGLEASGKPTKRTLILSLLATSLMVGAVVIFYWVFPGFTGYVFAGSRGKSIVGLVGLFGTAMAFFALAKLLSFYHLAVGKKSFLIFFAIGAVGEIVGISLFHGSLRQVVLVILAVGGFLCVSNLLLAVRELKEEQNATS